MNLSTRCSLRKGICSILILIELKRTVNKVNVDETYLGSFAQRPNPTLVGTQRQEGYSIVRAKQKMFGLKHLQQTFIPEVDDSHKNLNR